MIHNWLSALDESGHYLSSCVLDFSKAFDRIDHSIIIQKIIAMGVRPSLIPWICSFLTDRHQRVKIQDNVSDWLYVCAGSHKEQN